MVLVCLTNHIGEYIPYAKALCRLMGATAWIRCSPLADVICKAIEPLHKAVVLCRCTSCYENAALSLENGGITLGVPGLEHWNAFVDSEVCIAEALFDNMQERDDLCYSDNFIHSKSFSSPFGSPFPQMTHMVLYDMIRFSRHSKHHIVLYSSDKQWWGAWQNMIEFAKTPNADLFYDNNEIQLEMLDTFPCLEVKYFVDGEIISECEEYVSVLNWPLPESRPFEEWYAPFMSWAMKHNMNWRALLPVFDIEDLLISKLNHESTPVRLNSAEKAILRLHTILKNYDQPTDWCWKSFWDQSKADANPNPIDYFGREEPYTSTNESRRRENKLKAMVTLYGLSSIYTSPSLRPVCSSK